MARTRKGACSDRQGGSRRRRRAGAGSGILKSAEWRSVPFGRRCSSPAAERRSRSAEGTRAAARSVLDGRVSGGHLFGRFQCELSPGISRFSTALRSTLQVSFCTTGDLYYRLGYRIASFYPGLGDTVSLVFENGRGYRIAVENLVAPQPVVENTCVPTAARAR